MTIEKKTDQPIDEPFLARWSRVKQSGEVPALPVDATEGTSRNLVSVRGELVEPHAKCDESIACETSASTGSARTGVFRSSPEVNTSTGELLQLKTAGEARPEPTLPDSSVSAPLPSLDNMTPQSDFSPFMAKDVDPQLRNQAMKKLFTDPHYNVMDRLDIYIDDYSVHAPLPLDVIRRMSISKALRLFDDDEEDGDTANVAALEPSLPATKPAASTIVAPHATPDGAIVHRDPESVAGNAVDQAPAGKTL